MTATLPILLDADGVLAAFSAHTLTTVGSKLTPADVHEWSIFNVLKPEGLDRLALQRMEDPAWWADMPRMPGAMDLIMAIDDAGAEFAITQPVFDPRQLERFLRELGASHIPIVAGIWPLVSLRNAEFLANEVPGVVIPDEILQRMRRANQQSAEHALQEGIAIAREMLALVRGDVQGVQVSAPFGKVSLALDVLR